MLFSLPQPEGSSDTSTASKVAGVGKWAAQGAQSVARSAKNAVTGTDEAQENHSPAGSMQQRCAVQTSLSQNERLHKCPQPGDAMYRVNVLQLPQPSTCGITSRAVCNL